MNVLLNQDELVQKLLHKISQQASELSELNFVLEKSSIADSVNDTIRKKKNEFHSNKLMSNSNRNNNSNNTYSETKVNQISKRSSISNIQFKNTPKDISSKQHPSKTISYIDADTTMNHIKNNRMNVNSIVSTKSKTETDKTEIFDFDEQKEHNKKDFNQHIRASDSIIFHDGNGKKISINSSQNDHNQEQPQSILNPIEFHDEEKSRMGSTTLRFDNRIPVVHLETQPPSLPSSTLPLRHSPMNSIHEIKAIAKDENYTYPEQADHSLTVEEQREALQHHIQTNISIAKVSNPLTELLHQANSRINDMEKEKVDLLSKLSLTQQSVDSEVIRNKEFEKVITRIQKEYDEKIQHMSRELQHSQASEELVRKECIALRSELESKSVELEEIASMQSALLLQMQSKEISFTSINEELQIALRKLKQLELSFSQQENEKIYLTNQINTFQIELQQLHASYSKNLRVSSTNSPAAIHRQKALELELQTLHNSLADLRIESASKSDEIRKLSSHLSSLSDMNKEITNTMNDMKSYDTNSPHRYHHHHQSLASQSTAMTPQPNNTSTSPVSSSIHDSHNNNNNNNNNNNMYLLTRIASLLPWIRKVSEPLVTIITSLNDKIKEQSEHISFTEKAMESMRRETEVMKQQLGSELTRASQREALASRLLTEQRQRLDKVEPEITQGREARAIVAKIVETLQSTFMERLNSSESPNFNKEAIDVPLTIANLFTRQVTVTDQNVILLLKELLVEHKNYLHKIQQNDMETNNMSRQLQSISEELKEKNKENDLLHAELLATKRIIAESTETSSQKDNRRKNELAAAVELSERQNALIVTMEAKIDSLRQDRKLQQARVLSHQHREEICKDRLRKLLQDFVTNQSHTGNRFPLSIPHQIDEQKSFAELINYLTEALSYVTQIVPLSKTVSPTVDHSSKHPWQPNVGDSNGRRRSSMDIEHDENAFDHDAYEKFRNEFPSSSSSIIPNNITTTTTKTDTISKGGGVPDNNNNNNKWKNINSTQKYKEEEENDLGGSYNKRVLEEQIGNARKYPQLNSNYKVNESTTELDFMLTSHSPKNTINAASTEDAATPISTQYLSTALSNSLLRSPSVTHTATTINHREVTPTRSTPMRKRATPTTVSPPFTAAIPKLMQQRLKHAKSTLASLRR